MIFLLDENFPKSAAEHLRGLGHTVYDSRALGLSGATDALILKKSAGVGGDGAEYGSRLLPQLGTRGH